MGIQPEMSNRAGLHCGSAVEAGKFTIYFLPKIFGGRVVSPVALG